MDTVNEFGENVWFQMFHDYLVNPDTSYKKLSQSYGIPLRTVEAHGSKEQWPKKRAQVMLEVEKRIQHQAENEIVKHKMKLIQTGRILSGKALKRLLQDGLEPESAKDALSYLVEGMRLEGLGLGFDVRHPQIQNNFFNMQQINQQPIIMRDGTSIPPVPEKQIETNGKTQESLTS